jgi:hypothetical protein
VADDIDATVFDLADVRPWGTISPGMREALLEAARVMLDQFHTRRPARGRWTKGPGAYEDTAIHWTPSTTEMRITHANSKDAIEDGAYALALLAAQALGFQVVGRAPQGSGADWYMVAPSQPDKYLRLEVSGIAEGGSPGARLSEKVEQGMRGNVASAGLAVVFRFKDASTYSRAWS